MSQFLQVKRINRETLVFQVLIKSLLSLTIARLSVWIRAPQLGAVTPI